MADKTYRHPIHDAADPASHVVVPLKDESDGTFVPEARARLEAWDGTGWIKVRANAKGAIATDRGAAGAELAISADYTTAQAGAILLAVGTADLVHVTAVLVALSNTATQSPGVSLKIGSAVVSRHPGVPAGGGFTWSDLDVTSGNYGDDLIVACDNPGGTLSVTVHYWLEQ